MLQQAFVDSSSAPCSLALYTRYHPPTVCHGKPQSGMLDHLHTLPCECLGHGAKTSGMWPLSSRRLSRVYHSRVGFPHAASSQADDTE